MDVMQVAQFSESTDRKPDLSDMKVGQACCAQYSIDKRWYRASVLRHIDDATVEVGSIAKCAVKMTYDLLSLSFSTQPQFRWDSDHLIGQFSIPKMT